MKQILFILLLIPALSFAQDVEYKIDGYVNGKNIKELPSKYISIEKTMGAAMLGPVHRFVVYYGQRDTGKDKDFKLTDADGKVLTFTTMVAVYNFFDYNGYDLVEPSIANNTSILILFKKR